MPTRAHRPCAHAGCRRLVHSGRCEKHTRHRHRIDARGRGTAAQRGYDSTWRKVRATKLSADPLCERCERMGRTTAATLVHHKIPVRQDPSLRLALSNLMSLCVSCHPHEEAKSTQEAP